MLRQQLNFIRPAQLHLAMLQALDAQAINYLLVSLIIEFNLVVKIYSGL